MTNSTILLGRILLSLDLRDFRILISWLTPITEPIGWHFCVENVIYSLILVIYLDFSYQSHVDLYSFWRCRPSRI